MFFISHGKMLWLSECCFTSNEQFFSYIMARPTGCWIFVVLAHWNNSQGVDMSLHSNTLSWIRANQSLLFLLNAACLAEKQQIVILVFGLNLQSATLKASTLTITLPMWLLKCCMINYYYFLFMYIIHSDLWMTINHKTKIKLRIWPWLKTIGYCSSNLYHVTMY